MVNREAVAEWVAALRSGEYTQGTGALKQDNEQGTRHCCLGVACEVFAERLGLTERVSQAGTHLFDNFEGNLPPDVQAHLGLHGASPYVNTSPGKEVSLVRMNDDCGKTFAEIADAIERTYLTDVLTLDSEVGESTVGKGGS
jgi:hypothetical protein